MHPEDIEADPVPGELLVYRKGMKRVAVLVGLDRESYLIPLLDKVTLLQRARLADHRHRSPSGAQRQGHGADVPADVVVRDQSDAQSQVAFPCRRAPARVRAPRARNGRRASSPARATRQVRTL